MTPREQLVLAGLAAAIVIGAVALYRYDRPPDPAVGRPPEPALPAVAPPPAVEPAPGLSAPDSARPPGISGPPPDTIVVVAAMGAVRRPGLYRLPAEARVHDLLLEAGGATAGADLSDIDTLARLIDGTTLTVPMQPERVREANSLRLRAAPDTAALNPSAYLRSRIGVDALVVAPVGHAPAASPGFTPAAFDPNTATAEELDALPGIGPATAAKIIAHRERQPFHSIDDLTDVPGIGEKKLADIKAFLGIP